MVVDVLFGEIASLLFGGQRGHRRFVFAEEEFFVQSSYQVVAVLLCGVAEQYDSVGRVAVVADGVLASLRLVGELGEDGGDRVGFEVGRQVAQQNHAAAVVERGHPDALVMEAVLLAEVLVNRICRPCCRTAVDVHMLVGDILVIQQTGALPFHALPEGCPHHHEHNHPHDCRDGNQPEEGFVRFLAHRGLVFVKCSAYSVTRGARRGWRCGR